MIVQAFDCEPCGLIFFIETVEPNKIRARCPVCGGSRDINYQGKREIVKMLRK